MFKEACIENTSLLLDYIRAKVQRVELCDNLSVGGTTASLATIEHAKKVCQNHNIELACLIRARGGDFYYNDFEKEIMLKDIGYILDIGVDRIVIGALTKEDSIDYSYIKTLVDMALLKKRNVKITFHMAFDNIAKDKDYTSCLSVKKRKDSIAILAKLGIDTILTHGSNEKNSILENINILKDYINEAKKYNINIMPGGGLSYKNLNILKDNIADLKFVHGSKIVDIKKY